VELLRKAAARVTPGERQFGAPPQAGDKTHERLTIFVTFCRIGWQNDPEIVHA
jgi:hypothetical protein